MMFVMNGLSGLFGCLVEDQTLTEKFSQKETKVISNQQSTIGTPNSAFHLMPHAIFYVILHDGSDTHACVPCLRRSSFAQAGETPLRCAGTNDEKVPGD